MSCTRSLEQVLERFDDFLRPHAAFAPLDPREMVRAANRAPLHPGAERYYRERGWLPKTTTARAAPRTRRSGRARCAMAVPSTHRSYGF